MKALVLCEESGVWSRQLWLRGYDVRQVDLALRGDVQVASGWYQQGANVLDYEWGGYDVVCAFPPCTNLSKVGARLWRQKAEAGDVLSALELWIHCAHVASAAKLAGLVENPAGLASRALGEPSCAVNPWEFAETADEDKLKYTLLWLYGAWPLPMKRWAGSEDARTFIESVAPGPDQAGIRSKSWQGMASAFVSVLPHGGGAR